MCVKSQATTCNPPPSVIEDKKTPKIPGSSPTDLMRNLKEIPCLQNSFDKDPLSIDLIPIVGNPKLYEIATTEETIALSQNQMQYIMGEIDHLPIAFYPGDYAKLKDLKSKPELNGEEVLIMKPLYTNERVLRFECKFIGPDYTQYNKPKFVRVLEKNLELDESPMRAHLEQQKIQNQLGHLSFDATDADPKLEVLNQVKTNRSTGMSTITLTYSVKYKTNMTTQNESFHNACARGDLKKAKQALKQGAGINSLDYRNKGHTTGLWSACEKGFENVVAMLLSRGALHDLETVKCLHPSFLASSERYYKTYADSQKNLDGSRANTSSSCAPLMRAAEMGHVGCVKQLLSVGADPNARDSSGQSVLYSAVKHFKCVHALVDAGADINSGIRAGQRVVSIAAGTGCLESLKILINQGNLDIDAGIPPAIHQACNFSHWKCLEVLIKAGANIDILKRSESKSNDGTINVVFDINPLIIAVSQGRFKAVKKIISYGADINVSGLKGMCALTSAIIGQPGIKHKMVKLLLSLKANPYQKSMAGPMFDGGSRKNIQWTCIERARWILQQTPDCIELRTVKMLEKAKKYNM